MNTIKVNEKVNSHNGLSIWIQGEIVNFVMLVTRFSFMSHFVCTFSCHQYGIKRDSYIGVDFFVDDGTRFWTFFKSKTQFQ